MKSSSEVYDVFLSFPVERTSTAVEIEARLNQLGLSVFTPFKLAPGEDLGERVRDEIGACLSTVILLDEHQQLPREVAFELGAALAWEKPVYALVDSPRNLRPGTLPAAVRVVTPQQLQSIVKEIRAQSPALTDLQRESLARVYSEMNVTADQLTRADTALDKFADRFNKATHSRWSTQRLLRELMVMRKRGRLPKLRADRKNEQAARAS